MKTLFLLGMMVVGAGAQTAKPVAKQANTAALDNSWTSAVPTASTVVATLTASSMQVYSPDGVLIAKCDATGEWPHEVVSNCVISEGHALTEVMQAWMDSYAQGQKYQDARYAALKKAAEDGLDRIEASLNGTLPKSTKPAPKGAKP